MGGLGAGGRARVWQLCLIPNPILQAASGCSVLLGVPPKWMLPLLETHQCSTHVTWGKTFPLPHGSTTVAPALNMLDIQLDCLFQYKLGLEYPSHNRGPAELRFRLFAYTVCIEGSQ